MEPERSLRGHNNRMQKVAQGDIGGDEKASGLTPQWQERGARTARADPLTQRWLQAASPCGAGGAKGFETVRSADTATSNENIWSRGVLK